LITRLSPRVQSRHQAKGSVDNAANVRVVEVVVHKAVIHMVASRAKAVVAVVGLGRVEVGAKNIA
jgi:hypothetical protein